MYFRVIGQIVFYKIYSFHWRSINSKLNFIGTFPRIQGAYLKKKKGGKVLLAKNCTISIWKIVYFVEKGHI